MARPALNRGFTYREVLGNHPPGTTVLDYLCTRYGHSSPAEWRERVESGFVFLAGRPVDTQTPVVAGAVLEWKRPPWLEPGFPHAIHVLHEDAHLVAVDKPAGLPTLPGGGFLDHTLLALVRDRFPEASPMHRLGRWTSGVVLFARSELGRTGLSGAFRNRRVHKQYRALAGGAPSRDVWEIDTPIGPVPHGLLGTVHAASPQGRVAASVVRVVERREEDFLADVVIHTGRPHQIRIHLAASGHPLVGDPLYPVGGVPPPGTRAVPGDPGYLLHAAVVEVDHPAGGERIRIESPYPPELCLADSDPG